MIERLRRARDPLRPRPLRPRPIDVGFARDAPLKTAMRGCRLSGKATVWRYEYIGRDIKSQVLDFYAVRP